MKFKVVSSDSEGSASQDSAPEARISKMVEDNPVFLFMKGSPEAPQCGFFLPSRSGSQQLERSIPKFQCTFG